MMVYLVAVCLVIAFVDGGHVNPVEPFAVGDVCTKYRSVSQGVVNCQETSDAGIDLAVDVITSQAILDLVNLSCSNLPVWRQCIENRFMGCDNKEQILTNWDKSFLFCQGNAPASWIVNYASVNTVTVSKDCFSGLSRIVMPCFRDVMSNYTVPGEDTSLQDGIDMLRAAIAALFNCATANPEKSISDISECSGSSWKDVIFTTAMIGNSAPVGGFDARLSQELLNVIQGMLTS